MKQIEHPDVSYILRNGEPPTYGADKPPEPLECAICGATIDEEQGAYNLCSQCERKALARFRYLMLNEFTDYEREYLDACVEGCSLTEPEKLKNI